MFKTTIIAFSTMLSTAAFALPNPPGAPSSAIIELNKKDAKKFSMSHDNFSHGSHQTKVAEITYQEFCKPWHDMGMVCPYTPPVHF